MRLRHQLARNRLQDFFTIKRQKLAGLLDLESNELRQVSLPTTFFSFYLSADGYL